MTDNVHLPHVAGRVEFIVVDLTAQGDAIYRFCNAFTHDADSELVQTKAWAGQSWLCRPFTVTGSKRGDSVENVKVSIPDPEAALYIKLRSLKGAPGALVIRYQALADSVNAGINAPISAERMFINRYGGAVGRTCEIELASPLNYRKSKSPSFVMTRKHYPGLGSALSR